ncbi:MAG: DNA polymerase III subunit delta, partial [Pseudomonadota bacterium]
MKLKLDDLGASLSQGLLPIYLISGDEPLLVGEALDQIRTMARDNGYLERELHVAERGFDWAGLLANTGNLSLFAERRIIDLRLPTGKPGDGSKMIAALAEQPPEDTLVLISAPKLESSQLSSKWVKAIDKAGAIVRIWPIEAGALPGWINNRLRRQGLNASRDAVLQLARRVEGNLLAAKQEIDRLALECTGGELGVDDVENTVADSTRYTIFKLADEALAGRTPRALRMLAGLQREGLAPV